MKDFRAMHREGSIELIDAAVAVHTADGKVKIEETADPREGMRRERHDGEPTEVAPQEPAGSLAAAPWLRNLGSSGWLVLIASLTRAWSGSSRTPGARERGATWSVPAGRTRGAS